MAITENDSEAVNESKDYLSSSHHFSRIVKQTSFDQDGSSYLHFPVSKMNSTTDQPVLAKIIRDAHSVEPPKGKYRSNSTFELQLPPYIANRLHRSLEGRKQQQYSSVTPAEKVHGYKYSGASSLEPIDRGDAMFYKRETVKCGDHMSKYETSRLRTKLAMNMNIM